MYSTAHAQLSGHVMHVMAASMARGGVKARVLLRVARGSWWSRSREAAALATGRKLWTTGIQGVWDRLYHPVGRRQSGAQPLT